MSSFPRHVGKGGGRALSVQVLFATSPPIAGDSSVLPKHRHLSVLCCLAWRSFAILGTIHGLLFTLARVSRRWTWVRLAIIL